MAALTLPPPIPKSCPDFTKRGRLPPENKPSLLLSAEENQCIFKIIGESSQTIATAVVQLLLPDQNYESQRWRRVETGVACLIRDEAIKSYYIEVYSMQTKSSIFSQEIYNEFEYKISQDVFLTFEGDESMVGLNFADTSEASSFCEALNKKLKRNKRDERKRMSFVPVSPRIDFGPPTFEPAKPMPGLNVEVQITYGTIKKTKKKILKGDIGRPMDFRHIQHVGFDKNRGLDFNLTDNEFQAFFDKAGISANELQDENTRRFIQNFIKQHGGVQAIKSTIQDVGLKVEGAKPTRPPSPLPPRRPPPPTRTPQAVTPNADDFDNLPLPPPPPSPPMTDDLEDLPPPPPLSLPPDISNAPLPPPPPFPGDLPPPPPLPIFESDSPSAGRNPRPPPKKEESPRTDLFSQIVKGKVLRKVKASDLQRPAMKDTSNDLADSLKRALQGFRADVKPSDSESESDDEWD